MSLKREEILISFCITCKNRLNMLKLVLFDNLKKYIDNDNVEFVLLDYDSEDGLKEYIEQNYKDFIKSRLLSYFKVVNKEKEFRRCHAKNMAHKLGRGKILINLDCDVIIEKDVVDFVEKNFVDPLSILYDYELWKKMSEFKIKKFQDIIDVARKPDPGEFGFIGVYRDFFYEVGGYDESIRGYGYEDRDFVLRSEKNGGKKLSLPSGMLRHLEHSHSYVKEEDFKNNYCVMYSNDKNNIFRVNDNSGFGKGSVFHNFEDKILNI